MRRNATRCDATRRYATLIIKVDAEILLLSLNVEPRQVAHPATARFEFLEDKFQCYQGNSYVFLETFLLCVKRFPVKKLLSA